MARPTPSTRPSALWGFFGLAMLAHFALLAWFKRTHNIDGELLWFSHAGLLLGALALIARSTNLAATAFILVAGFHILWIADATIGLLTGDFPVGGTRFLLTADIPTLALTTHHLYLAPILAFFLVRRRSMPIAALPAALILLIALTATSRLTLPPSMNINYAHAALASSNNPALVWFNALPTRLYLPVHAAFCLLVFLTPSAIIMKTLIAAHILAKRRATTARVSPQRRQATQLLAQLGRGTAGRGFTLIELLAVLIVLAVLAGVALPRYFNFSADAKDSADDASIAAINTALDNAFTHHRAEGSDPDDCIDTPSMVASVMEGDELPFGITLDAGVFTDQRGNTYQFTAETLSSPARLRRIDPGGAGAGGGAGGGGAGGDGGGGAEDADPPANFSS